MTNFEHPKFNSKANTKKYEDNYDRIFKKKTEETKQAEKK